MKGELRYYEPDAEINYSGGWAVNEGEGINKVTYKLSDDSMKWILENKPSKLMDVEFTVVSNCYFYEDTKRGTHQLVAELSFVDKVKTFTIKDLEKAFKRVEKLIQNLIGVMTLMMLTHMIISKIIKN